MGKPVPDRTVGAYRRTHAVVKRGMARSDDPGIVGSGKPVPNRTVVAFRKTHAVVKRGMARSDDRGIVGSGKYTEFNPVPFEAHMLVLGKVNAGETVLDVGCATGYFARELAKKHCTVYGIDIDAQAVQQAKQICKDAATIDVEKTPTLPWKIPFDTILCMDILEHVRNPKEVLVWLSRYLAKDGRIIISIPNVAHVSIRAKLVRGIFTYEEKGIMDTTHVRFFTKKTLTHLIEDAGLCIDSMDYSADFGQLPAIARLARKLPKALQHAATGKMDTLLAIQFVAVCKKKGI